MMSKPIKIWQKKAANIYRQVRYALVSDEKYLVEKHIKLRGYKPDLNIPKTFTEKLLYLMLHYRNPLETLCADKLFVREYVNACGLGSIIRPVIAVYNRAEDIDFNILPDEFFLKCNHISGNNMVINKAENPDYDYIRKFYREVLKTNYYYESREYCYKGIRPVIMVEKCLRDSKGALPKDYKFYCFSGEPKYFMVSEGEFEHEVKNHKFDMNKESIDHKFKKRSTLSSDEVVLPENIDEMFDIVNILCKPFPHVRVDLYNVDGKIYFGELTFYSNGGFVSVYDQDFDREIGSWIKLDKYKEAMI